MTVKELKDWLKDLPEDQNVEVRLRGNWMKDFNLRIKYVKLIGPKTQMSHQTSADDE
jgi:hypothetical protein